MVFDQIRLFRDIAQTRSVSKAAEANHISQSAASQQLQEWERAMEVQLLDRSTRPVRLTEAGRLYYELCQDVLRRKEQFDAALEDLKGEVGGLVRVASIYSVGLSEMTHLKREFSHRHPGASLRVDYLRPEKVYEAVESDQADLGLVSYPEATARIAVIEWRSEQMAVAASPAHPLAGQGPIPPAALEGLDFIGFDEELPIQRAIQRFLRDHGVRVNITIHFDNLQMIKEAVELGSGVAIVPARILDAEVAQGRLACIPLSAELSRPLGIIHRRKKRFNRATQSFLALLQETPGR